jgi:cyanophycinase
LWAGRQGRSPGVSFISFKKRIFAMSNGSFFVDRRVFLGFAALLLSPFQSAAAGETRSNKADFKGTLYPIGGAAELALCRFAELAGGSEGKIVIMPHSSSTPKDSAEELANSFMALGVKNTETIMPGENKSLPKCTGIYMGGGDQSRMLRLLDRKFVEQLSAFLWEGGVVAGSSAGAAAMACRMIADGMSDGLPVRNSLCITDGLGLLPGYMVDTHVGKRGRHDRLMVGLTMEPGVRGIGLDEDTAVEIKNGRATVHGKGVAHVYRRAPDFKSELPSTLEGRMASVQNVIYSIFPAGESFEI